MYTTWPSTRTYGKRVLVPEIQIHLQTHTISAERLKVEKKYYDKRTGVL